MISLYQILAFYCVLAFVTTALVGIYPRLDPEAVHLALHMKLGKASAHPTMLIALIGIVGLSLQFKIASSLNIAGRFLIWLKGCLVGLMVCASAFAAYKSGRALETGTVLLNELSKRDHLHHNMLCLIIVVAGLFVLARYLQIMSENIRQARRNAGIPVKEYAFLEDEHFYGFERAKQFLFLGINVWWPFLVLYYGVGLTELKPMWFLPVHLAGVLPFSYLKRKHKFKRTINPAYKGTIRNAARYAPKERM
jgi:hypothetical protein